MKTGTAAVFALLFCALLAVAQKPQTVDEAVQILKTKWLKPKDLDWILRNPKDDVVWTLYRPFGTGMRNEFGLWGDNQPLHDSCGTENPEGCSVVIFKRLWESVRHDADPTLIQQLDCQFQLVNAIHVSLKGLNQLTTKQMIRRLQSQIDAQVSTLTASGTPTCNGSLTLEVEGNPDLGCFVYAPHGKDAGNVNDMTLDRALSTSGIQNMFMTIHYPPKLQLDFFRKCQFPQPFPY
jgi:hypothetical protein